MLRQSDPDADRIFPQGTPSSWSGPDPPGADPMKSTAYAPQRRTAANEVLWSE
ncbi:hypothetical protein [Streptomyces flaveolus]|uniref:hypothetical protein n=1 Tax=Streptomyces flaveolus TaxID=67297 RepID=UPI0036FAEF95